ncbi:hypothetical protein LCGC14_0808140, partial [marine sediment metagenome]
MYKGKTLVTTTIPELDADGNGWDKKSGDQHPVLGDLRPGDALHAPKHGVEEYQPHADEHAVGDLDVEETAENHPHATHLARHVG